MKKFSRTRKSILELSDDLSGRTPSGTYAVSSHRLYQIQNFLLAKIGESVELVGIPGVVEKRQR